MLFLGVPPSAVYLAWDDRQQGESAGTPEAFYLQLGRYAAALHRHQVVVEVPHGRREICGLVCLLELGHGHHTDRRMCALQVLQCEVFDIKWLIHILALSACTRLAVPALLASLALVGRLRTRSGLIEWRRDSLRAQGSLR